MSFRVMKFELMSFVNELNPLQCGVRLNRSYKTLLDMEQWSFLKREALINLAGAYVTGTVTAVTGATTVTGIGTAWTAGMAGRFIRLSTEPEAYKISSVDPVLQTLVVESAIGTGTAGSGYSIFARWYPKPTDCKHIIGVRRELSLNERTQAWLDGFDPDRTSTGPPIYWCNFDAATMEIYPPADQTYTVRVTYIVDVADMSAETDVPLLPENLIITHAVFAAYRQLGSRPEGKGYLAMVPMAQEEFKQAWTAAYEVDMNKRTMPTQVLQDGVDLPTSSDFWIGRDDFWSGG